ncbi:DsbA family protein [Nocardioides halotolerans]|uniref:DsbA family protein n=1 Tax=Nocardioides halotolerans TaxID=433660 RepID=UPI0012F8D6D1|nr:thioredoxin domain-containing protein [Nocardioides halotolerans]
MVGIFFAMGAASDDGPVAKVDTSKADSPLLREDSRIIGEEGASGVTFVEFLDFECEACLALFPIVEQLREDYAGEVTFVARYFPLPGHFNSERAARTVESAARQGKFEEMYMKMYDTQTSWSEKQEPMDDLFRSYAEELGLDMAQFDADYSSEEVAARVQRDVDDGTSLEVQGTPTLYIDGELIQPESAQDLVDAIDAALTK